MKRILYLTFIDSENEHFGVEKKIKSQCKVFMDSNFQTTIIYRENGNTVIKKLNSNRIKVENNHFKFRFPVLKTITDKVSQQLNIIKHLKTSNYDFCYIRYDLSDPLFLMILRKLNQNGTKIIIEIPTFPYNSEYSRSIFHAVKYYWDRIWSIFMHLYVYKIVTFYKGREKIHNINTLVIPNGFDYSEVELAKTRDIRKKSEINLLGVASMREWHGYERLILGMKNYYSNHGEMIINFNVVGDGPELTKYKELVNNHNLNNYITFHGVKNGRDLEDIYDISDIGIDSLARHRTGINVLSSLKSREYGSKGIPFINSCKIDVIEEDFEYFLEVEASEDPINVNEIIQFYDKIYFAGKGELEIKNDVRNYLENRTSMSVAMSPIIRDFTKK